MATNFPASLDTLTNPTSSDSLSSPSHSAQHANVNDAVEALQAKVGADSSAVATSLDYKIAQLEALGTATAYTPTYTNMSLGNGTVTASYVLVQNLLSVVVEFEFGSTSTISGNPAISIPSGLTWVSNSGVIGGCRLRDEGTANYIGIVQANPNGMLLVGMGSSGTYSPTQIINATNPFAWTTTDKIQLYATGSVA